MKIPATIFKILDLIPYRTSFGLSISDVLKVLYYQKVSKKTCLCGGHIYTRGIPPDGWETSCTICEFLFDED